MKGYGQFCPVAKATELIGERWTLLVLRELLPGPAAFNDIRKGVPLMSPSLLSTRLKSLGRNGLVERCETAEGVRYRLTDAGGDLRPIIIQLGLWALRWGPSHYQEDDLDPRLLMWDLRRQINASELGPARTVIRIEFCDQPSKLRFWWVLVENTEVDICLKDPGYEVDLYIASDLNTMTQIWMGKLAIKAALANESMALQGRTSLIRSLPQWLGRSVFAEPELLKAQLLQG